MENFILYLESFMLEKDSLIHFFPTCNEMDWIQEMKLYKSVFPCFMSLFFRSITKLAAKFLCLTKQPAILKKSTNQFFKVNLESSISREEPLKRSFCLQELPLSTSQCKNKTLLGCKGEQESFRMKPIQKYQLWLFKSHVMAGEKCEQNQGAAKSSFLHGEMHRIKSFLSSHGKMLVVCILWENEQEVQKN